MTADESPEGDLRSAVRRKAPFGRTVLAVAWSFFGVRKARDHQRDVDELNPIHLAAAALIAALLFVLALVGLVHWVLASGIAR